jgi:GTP-binding protein Era
MAARPPAKPDFRSGYVALVGQPNVGKSTLMNRLLQSRLAIVSPKPQTTRRRILGIVSGEAHQIILLDTPGILDPKYLLQKAMMKTVSSVLSDADVACLLLDERSSSPGRPEIPEGLALFSGPRVAVLNKIDLLRPKESMIPILQGIGETGLFADIVPLSALTGEGVDRLIPILAGHLPAAPPFYPTDQITEQPERFFVAELIRERVFYHFEKEIPYAVEVEITEFKERRGAKDFIQAVLFVEQQSQKGILVGRGGQAIRRLGEEARESIEEFLGRPVYLELRVKVARKWRRDGAALRRLGYRT